MIAACLIVKDEEHCIERILSSIDPCVDGIWVYDTGSTDNTVALAKEYGTVVEGEWRNDFAWARNQSYALPPDDYEWLVYFDADDSVEGADALRGLAENALPWVTGFKFPYLNTWGNLQVDYNTLRLTRRNHYIWRWPLHEQLVPVGEEHVVESEAVIWRQVHSLEDRQAHTQRNLDFLLAFSEGREIDDWLASAIVLTMIEQGRAREAHQWMLDNKYVMDIRRSNG